MDIQSSAREFLSQKRIAVAGVSARRDTPANLIFKTLRSRGTEVIPIGSSGREYEGVRCYPDVKSVPVPLDGLIIVTSPAVAEALAVTPMFFDHSFYCRKCGSMASNKTCPNDSSEHLTLSGTKVREMLRRGELPPGEFSRPEVAAILIESMKQIGG